MADFDSLVKALDRWFGHSLSELPGPIKRRVIADYRHLTWDDLTPEGRRSIARQHDYQHDPNTEDHREFWFNLWVEKDVLLDKIADWEKVAAPTALDLSRKQEELAIIRAELAHLQRLDDILMQRHFPRIRSEGESTDDDGIESYLALPKALSQLQQRLESSVEEIAAWVFIGPDDGGIRAYTKVNNLQSLSRFWFEPEMDPDYVSLLFNCWFSEKEIAEFEPTERFISGMALVDRWAEPLGDKARAYILAKVATGVLMDLHPVKGATNATAADLEDRPDVETGLFAMSEIEKVEQSEGLAVSIEEKFSEKCDQESPKQRKLRLQQWYDIECRREGKRGAYVRVAKREDISAERVRQILKRPE